MCDRGVISLQHGVGIAFFRRQRRADLLHLVRSDVLRAQAVDVREAGKRALLEAGGRKEVSMMLPVVFLILPVTVLFALYPGLLTLTSLAH